jgi:uncharacterized membrane protein
MNTHEIGLELVIKRVRVGYNNKISPFLSIAAYITLPELAILSLFPHLALPSALLWIISYCILITLSYFLGKREEKVEKALNGKKKS